MDFYLFVECVAMATQGCYGNIEVIMAEKFVLFSYK